MSEKTNNWSAVIVALLGLVGVLVAALIGLMGSQKSAVELSISATMTAEASLVTALAPTITPILHLPEAPMTNTPDAVDPTVESPSEIATPEPTSSSVAISRFPVDASIPKNRTEISVSTGDRILIEYLDGNWTGLRTNPGMSMGCQASATDSNIEHIYPLPLDLWGDGMIGYIGTTPFGVGCQITEIDAFGDGDLYLGMNDCLNCFFDNEGIIYVRVSVRRQ